MEFSLSLRRTTKGIIILMVSLCLSGCNVLQFTSKSTGEESQYGQVEQAMDNDDGSDIENVSIIPCPIKATEFTLGASHGWDFSPGRDLSQMKIDGWTDPFSMCKFIIEGSSVTFPDCSRKCQMSLIEEIFQCRG